MTEVPSILHVGDRRVGGTRRGLHARTERDEFFVVYDCDRALCEVGRNPAVRRAARTAADEKAATVAGNIDGAQRVETIKHPADHAFVRRARDVFP